MRALITNNWFVGLATGIISGLVVYFITKWLLTKSVNRERQQKVLAANREVIYSLRIFVSEQKSPERDVVMALTASTARKYDLNVGEMLEVDKVAQDLLKEVMDSSFINAETKKSYCQLLAPLMIRDIKSERSIDFRTEEPDRDSAFGSAVGVAAGLGASIFGFASYLIINIHKQNVKPLNLGRLSILAIVVSVTAIAAFTTVSTFTEDNWRRRLKQRRKIRREIDRAVRYAEDYNLKNP